MDIIWHGKTAFTVKGKKTTVVVNPEKDSKLKGDVVLTSLDDQTGEVKDASKVIDWPGEYEVKGVPIVGFQAWTDTKGSGKAEETIIYFFKIGSVKFCHLGELGHVLTSELVNKIGDIDILMIKAGKEANLDAKKAIEVIEAIDPRAVIPMGDTSKDGFLKELGASENKAEDKFSLKKASELPNDKRITILLKSS